MLKQKKKNYFMNKYMFNNFKILKKFKWLLMKYRSRKFYKKFFFFENFNKNRLIYDKDEYYKKDKYFSQIFECPMQSHKTI